MGEEISLSGYDRAAKEIMNLLTPHYSHQPDTYLLPSVSTHQRYKTIFGDEEWLSFAQEDTLLTREQIKKSYNITALAFTSMLMGGDFSFDELLYHRCGDKLFFTRTTKGLWQDFKYPNCQYSYYISSTNMSDLPYLNSLMPTEWYSIVTDWLFQQKQEQTARFQLGLKHPIDKDNNFTQDYENWTHELKNSNRKEYDRPQYKPSIWLDMKINFEEIDQNTDNPHMFFASLDKGLKKTEYIKSFFRLVITPKSVFESIFYCSFDLEQQDNAQALFDYFYSRVEHFKRQHMDFHKNLRYYTSDVLFDFASSLEAAQEVEYYLIALGNIPTKNGLLHAHPQYIHLKNKVIVSACELNIVDCAKLLIKHSVIEYLQDNDFFRVASYLKRQLDHMFLLMSINLITAHQLVDLDHICTALNTMANQDWNTIDQIFVSSPQLDPRSLLLLLNQCKKLNFNALGSIIVQTGLPLLFDSKYLGMMNFILSDIQETHQSFFYKLITNKPNILAETVYAYKKNHLRLLPFSILTGNTELSWFIIKHPLSSTVQSIQMNDFLLIQRRAFDLMVLNQIDLFTRIVSMSPRFCEYLDDTQCHLQPADFNEQDLQGLQAIEAEKFDKQQDLFEKIQKMSGQESQQLLFTDRNLELLKNILGDRDPLSIKLLSNRKVGLIDYAIQNQKKDFIEIISQYAKQENIEFLARRFLSSLGNEGHLFLPSLKPRNQQYTKKTVRFSQAN
jgi:hypothetical protein